VSAAGEPPKFVLKGDDDIYYNLPLIRNNLLHSGKWSVPSLTGS
jgi:hypothetical protein